MSRQSRQTSQKKLKLALDCFTCAEEPPESTLYEHDGTGWKQLVSSSPAASRREMLSEWTGGQGRGGGAGKKEAAGSVYVQIGAETGSRQRLRTRAGGGRSRCVFLYTLCQPRLCPEQAECRRIHLHNFIFLWKKTATVLSSTRRSADAVVHHKNDVKLEAA